MPLAKNIGPTILDIGHGNDFGFDGGDPCEDGGGGRRGERSQFVPLVNSVELLTIARRWVELCKKTRLGPEDRLESQ